jgi:WD40 repeat protein
MWSAAFSPDGREIVTTDDRNAQVWDAATGRRIHILPHGGTVFHAAYSADGAWIATAGGDGAVRIWDPASGSLVRELKHEGKRPHYYVVAISGDRRLVAAVTMTGDATDVWSADSGSPSSATPNAHEQARDARARVVLRQRPVRGPRHTGDDIDGRVAGEERDRGTGHGCGEREEAATDPGITRPRDERDRK